MFTLPSKAPPPPQDAPKPTTEQAKPAAHKPRVEVDLGLRNLLLGVGIGAVFSARYFKQKLMLRPFQASVLTAWPSLGVAVMQTVIANSAEWHGVEVSPGGNRAPEEQVKASESNPELANRLKKLAEASQKQ